MARPAHIAIVTDKRGRILAVAPNSYTKTHPKQKALGKKVGRPGLSYLHAEVAAIIKAQRRGTPYAIRVLRYFADGSPAPSAPCPACSLAIKQAGIKRVYHT